VGLLLSLRVASWPARTLARARFCSHAELLVDVFEVLSHGRSLDYQDPRDLDVRKTVGHPEHHLALAAGQSLGGVRVECPRCRAKPPSELGGSVQPYEVRVEPLQEQPFAISEITLARDVEPGKPSPRGIEVDLDLVGNPLLKVGIEIDGGPLAPVEEV